MSLGVIHIDKHEFLPLYQQARVEALHENNVQSGFVATGLVPFNPDRVLSLLLTQYDTPSPQLLPQEQPEWTAETPHDILELQHQTELIKRYIHRHTHSPPSPTEQALNQLVKGCQIAMHNAVILANQNEKLFAENQRQKRKRNQRRSYIGRGGILTGAEAQNRIETERNI